MTEQFEAKINPQRYNPRLHTEPPSQLPPEKPKSNAWWIILVAVAIAAAMLSDQDIGTKHIGLAAILLFAGFAQFNLVTNKSPVAIGIWLVVMAASVYFYALLGFAAFVIGGMLGAKLGFNKLRPGR